MAARNGKYQQRSMGGGDMYGVTASAKRKNIWQQHGSIISSNKQQQHQRISA